MNDNDSLEFGSHVVVIFKGQKFAALGTRLAEFRDDLHEYNANVLIIGRRYGTTRVIAILGDNLHAD